MSVIDDDLTPFTIANLLGEQIEDGKIELDIGGHFATGKKINSHQKEYLCNAVKMYSWGGDSMTTKDACHVAKVLEGKAKPKPWIKLYKSILFQCDQCGEKVALQTNGKKIRCTNPCKYPNGLPPYSIELNVPSGKMVIANDLRRWWKIIGDYDVNLIANCKKTTEKYAEAGMAYAFVGNTMPGVYKINEKKFVIGTSNSRNSAPIKGAKRVGGICTDLWWFSIVDFDDFTKRVGEKPEEEKYQCDIVACKPGVYRFQHRYHLCDRDNYNAAQVYTQINWVRKPDPVRDTLVEFNSLNFTAGQIIANKLNRMRDYYTSCATRANGKKEPTEADILQRVADSMMCVLGGGMEYHPNGWIGDDPDLTMDAPSVEIPILKKKYNWYPLSDYSFICHAAGVGKDWNMGKMLKMKDIHLNESFLKLAFNVCHCIAKYGVDDEHKQRAKETQEWGLKALKGFVKKHPQSVPKYVTKFLEESQKCPKK